MDATEDQMNRLCNEKIMAIDEFSKQLLEKIENNHKEVVFMYNMLNEKEKEFSEITFFGFCGSPGGGTGDHFRSVPCASGGCDRK